MRRVAAFLALALLLTACGPKTKLALNMRSVNITAPRIITPAIELVPAAPLPPALPDIEPIALPPVPKRAPEAATCKTADPFAVPAVPASVTVNSAPAPATYIQSEDGTFKGLVATTITQAAHGKTSDGVPVDTWLVVHTDSGHKAAWAEAYQLVHAGSSTPAAVWLVGLAWDDPVRGKFVFQPTGNGVEILPTPVQRAQNDTQYIGAATDPNTLATLQITRNVRDRARVDACGSLIDTFTVEITGTLTTTSDTREIAWTQHWATAYGAIDVEDEFSLTNPVDHSTYISKLRNTTVPKAVA
jgi:hypothetical protein